MVTAALLYVLSWRRGIDGQRLVLVGIGLGRALNAVTRTAGEGPDPGRRQRAGLAQRLAQRPRLGPRLAADRSPGRARAGLAAARPHLNALQLGDDTARGLGVRLQITQLGVLLSAVGLAAVAVSAVGPLEFVAFVVPQIALRLTGGSRPPMLASMVFGGVLVVAPTWSPASCCRSRCRPAS